jgi:raffinose/stachyose/melibiose transport system substrate-binding protein
MITTGSWDSPSFRAQADFEIGVFNVPIPQTDHPRFGEGVIGTASEAETGTGLSFGIPRRTKNFDRSVDFLRFLASKPGNTTFSRISGWLPAVVGVDAPEYVKPFIPETHGYVNGFEPSFYLPFGNTLRVINNQMNTLVGTGGSVEAYKANVRAPMGAAVEQDIRRSLHNNTLNVNRQDVVLAALSATDDADAEIKRSQLLEAQNKIEASTAWMNLELEILAEKAR